MKHKAQSMAALMIGCLSPFLSAQEPRPTLTLSQAMERGLARPDLQAVAEGRLALAESEVLQQKTWDNPQLYVSTEDIDQAGVGTGETHWLVSQRVDLFGIRGLRTRAAEHARQAVHFENETRQRDLEALIREWFYNVLYVQERVAIWRTWENDIARIADIIAKRERAGEVSGYDRRRISRELSEARAMTANDRAVHAGKWERLAALVDLDEVHTLAGTLLPPAREPEMPLTESPRFRAYDETIDAASLETMAARKWILPEITLEAGLKETRSAGENEAGVFLSARIPLPVFDRKKSSHMRAQANATIARAEKALALAETEGRLMSLKKQIRLNRDTIERFRVEAIGTSRELVDIAEAAYGAGEAEILILLDAYGSLRDAALQALAMEADTRSLFIELQRLGGEQ